LKILAICSSLDLREPFGATPLWWQILKGLYEVGVEVITAPYQGPAVESLWWKAYDNPVQLYGSIFKRIRDQLGLFKAKRIEGVRRDEGLGDKIVRRVAQFFVRPAWMRHVETILKAERDVDLVLIMSVPLNHIVGLPTFIRDQYHQPVLFFDGDTPASLPSFQGFATGFRIYQGADLGEYDAFILPSKGGADELEKLGAKETHVLYHGIDPAVFSPVSVAQQDIDFFYYGHGSEYRREWIEAMIAGPSRSRPAWRFAVRGTGMDFDLGRTERLPYAALSKLREYACRSKLNLNIVRQSHAAVFASSTPRLFEMAALGACVVTNPYPGLEEWFEPGREVFMVHDAAEVLPLYDRLLSDERTRKEVGERARRRALTDHTYQQRAQQLKRILERYV